MTASDGTVVVETPARLHFGVLDLRGDRGRWFGGVGAAAPAPILRLSATAASSLSVEGEDADRATGFARTFLAAHGIETGARISVERALPAHAGLGSGTQLGLAVARALAELHGLPIDADALARAVGRAQRSAIGTWTFAGGGLVVEGGRRADRDEAGLLIARVPFPASWHCVVAVPKTAPAISGPDEAAAIANLPLPSAEDTARMAHLVANQLVPALADENLPAFGRALTEMQLLTGRWFSPVQGGEFAPGPSAAIVRRLAEWGAAGVGQSSWGPTVYGIVDGADAGARLADRARDLVDACGGGDVYEGPFRAEGARVSRVT